MDKKRVIMRFFSKKKGYINKFLHVLSWKGFPKDLDHIFFECLISLKANIKTKFIVETKKGPSQAGSIIKKLHACGHFL